MREITLLVEKRGNSGKGIARKLRYAGMVPGVLYGPDNPSILLTADPNEIRKTLRDAGRNTILTLKTTEGDDTEIDGKLAIFKDFQYHPVNGNILHVDFYEISMKKQLTIDVRIDFAGKSKDEETGAVRQESLKELYIRCLPKDIPESIKLDVSELSVGDTLFVRDIELPEGVEVMEDLDTVVFSILAPEKEEVPEKVEEEAEAEEGAVEEGAEEGAAEESEETPAE